MAVQLQALSDEQKKEWTDRCAAEPAFRDALIVETYVMVQQMLGLAASVAAQMGPAVAMMSKLGLGGNGKA